MLRSRLDRIAASLDEEMDAVASSTAKAIAAGAAERAPRGSTGDLAEGYEAEKVSSGGWAVMALWRWFFTEFGTTESGAQPHVIPAVEAERNKIDNHARAALKDL
jgi:HK97 gp10 family phage protein